MREFQVSGRSVLWWVRSSEILRAYWEQHLRQGRTRDHAVVPVLALQLAVLRGVRVLVDVADPIGVFLCVVQDAGVDILVMRMRHVDFERDGDSASFFHQSTDSANLRKRQKTNFLRDYTIEMLYGTNAVSESDAESGTA